MVGLQKGVRSRRVLARKPSWRPGRNCIRLSLVFTSAVIWLRLRLGASSISARTPPVSRPVPPASHRERSHAVAKPAPGTPASGHPGTAKPPWYPITNSHADFDKSLSGCGVHGKSPRAVVPVMADHASTQYCRQTRYAKSPSILRAFKPWCLNVCTLVHYSLVELDAARAQLKFTDIESLSDSS